MHCDADAINLAALVVRVLLWIWEWLLCGFYGALDGCLWIIWCVDVAQTHMNVIYFRVCISQSLLSRLFWLSFRDVMFSFHPDLLLKVFSILLLFGRFKQDSDAGACVEFYFRQYKTLQKCRAAQKASQ